VATTVDPGNGPEAWKTAAEVTPASGRHPFELVGRAFEPLGFVVVDDHGNVVDRSQQAFGPDVCRRIELVAGIDIDRGGRFFGERIPAYQYARPLSCVDHIEVELAFPRFGGRFDYAA
jgi:hypothetical protein